MGHGLALDGDVGREHPYKLRTIACAEVLLKAVEDAVVAASHRRTIRLFAPLQLGTGAPGAAPLIVQLVQ
eukprot:9735393-Karenia_brevis.AAC.1